MSNQSFIKLQAKVRSLLQQEGGCPWLQQQNWRSIANYSQEEVYELIDAIERQDFAAIKDELADLCFHLLIYAQMGADEGVFDLESIAQAALTKLEQRQLRECSSAQDMHANWQSKKYENKQAEAGSILGDLSNNLPATLLAKKLLEVAAQIGVDGAQSHDVLQPLEQKSQDLQQAVQTDERAQVQAALGALMMQCIALANHYDMNAEEVLRQTASQFKSQLRALEQAAQQQQLNLLSLDAQTLDSLYALIKAQSAKD